MISANILLTLYLCLPLILGQFTSVPEKPAIGDSLTLKCRLNAPSGSMFSSTVPKLKTDKISHPFYFTEIAEMFDLRYNGGHIPDLNRVNLAGDFTIIFLNESDFSTLFICFAVLENDTFFEYTIILNSSVSTTEQPNILDSQGLIPPNEGSCNCITTTSSTCNNQTIANRKFTFWEAIGITSITYKIIIMIVTCSGGLLLVSYFSIRRIRSTKTYRTNNPDPVDTIGPPAVQSMVAFNPHPYTYLQYSKRPNVHGRK